MKLQHTRPSGDGQIANAIKKLQREVEGLRASQAPNALLSRTTRGTAVRPNAGPSNIAKTHVVARWL